MKNSRLERANNALKVLFYLGVNGPKYFNLNRFLLLALSVNVLYYVLIETT